MNNIFIFVLHKIDPNMKTASNKRIKEIAKLLGVNLTFDKSLDKYSKIVPEKVEESSRLFANVKLSF